MSAPEAGFERLGGEIAYEGKIATVTVDRFRHADGGEVTREIVRHPGAVMVVPHDEERIWLVRQPREAVDTPDLLELPAGKLDEEGEEPLETARRELAEEIGKAAERWEHLTTFYSSPGFTDEEVWIYLATGLSDVEVEAEENERITIEPWPLERLDDLIAGCRDAKTLVGLLWLRLRRGQPLRPGGARP
jgi:8-oxo-dGTP pyrophosphatase MutT (NUDIX family)